MRTRTNLSATHHLERARLLAEFLHFSIDIARHLPSYLCYCAISKETLLAVRSGPFHCFRETSSCEKARTGIQGPAWEGVPTQIYIIILSSFGLYWLRKFTHVIIIAFYWVYCFAHHPVDTLSWYRKSNASVSIVKYRVECTYEDITKDPCVCWNYVL